MEMVKIRTSDGVIVEMPKTALEHYPHLKILLLQDNTETLQTETQTPSSDTETEEKQDMTETSSEQTLPRRNQRTSKKSKDVEETQQ
jgi:hypothetical protein